MADSASRVRDRIAGVACATAEHAASVAAKEAGETLKSPSPSADLFDSLQ